MPQKQADVKSYRIGCCARAAVPGGSGMCSGGAIRPTHVGPVQVTTCPCDWGRRNFVEIKSCKCSSKKNFLREDPKSVHW